MALNNTHLLSFLWVGGLSTAGYYHVGQIMGVRSRHLGHILLIRIKSQVQPTLTGGGRMWREHQEVGITIESACHDRQWQPEST